MKRSSISLSILSFMNFDFADARINKKEKKSAKLKQLIPIIVPEDAGDLYIDILYQVRSRISLEYPMDSSDYLKVVSEAFLTLCEGYGHECITTVDEITRQSDCRNETNFRSKYVDENILFVNELDEVVRLRIQEILDAAEKINFAPYNSVINEIKNVCDKSKKNIFFGHDSRDFICSIASIAVGSSQYWINVENDVKKAFFHFHRRKSYGTRSFPIDPEVEPALVFDIVPFISSDIDGAIHAFQQNTSVFRAVVGAINSSLCMENYPPLIILTCFLIDVLSSDMDCNVTDMLPQDVINFTASVDSYFSGYLTALHDIFVSSILEYYKLLLAYYNALESLVLAYYDSISGAVFSIIGHVTNFTDCATDSSLSIWLSAINILYPDYIIT